MSASSRKVLSLAPTISSVTHSQLTNVAEAAINARNSPVPDYLVRQLCGVCSL